MPASSGWVGSQLSFERIKVLSEFRPRTPVGPGIFLMESGFSAMRMTMRARLLMDIISTEPILTGPEKFERVRRVMASTHSSIYRNDRVCEPSPQISISPPDLAIATLRHIAAGAF